MILTWVDRSSATGELWQAFDKDGVLVATVYEAAMRLGFVIKLPNKDYSEYPVFVDAAAAKNYVEKEKEVRIPWYRRIFAWPT